MRLVNPFHTGPQRQRGIVDLHLHLLTFNRLQRRRKVADEHSEVPLLADSPRLDCPVFPVDGEARIPQLVQDLESAV